MNDSNRTNEPARMRIEAIRISHAGILAVLAILGVILIVSSSVVLGIGAIGDLDRPVLILFAVNYLLGSIFLIRDLVRFPFSIIQMHWVFYISFFVIAPLAQYLSGYSCWNYMLSRDDYFDTNVLVMVWGLIIALITSFSRAKRLSYKGFSDELYLQMPEVSSAAARVMLILSGIVTFIFVRAMDFSNLFSRATYVPTFSSSALNQLFDKGFRTIPVFALFFIYAHYRQKRGGKLLIVLAAISLIISNFPTSLARYALATLYGGLALLLVRPFLEKRGLFPFLFLLMLVVVFPAIAVFRTRAFGFSLLFRSLRNVIVDLPSGFCGGDYDAYSMLARSRIYIRDMGMTMGRQLLTALLFFVPRSVWPGKAIGSGALIASSQGQIFTNVSCPLPAEGIMNYGVVGLIITAAITGLLMYKLNEWFYEGPGAMRAYYVFLAVQFFFIMRGDFLSSWAYTCGYTFIYVVLLAICRFLSSGQENVPKHVRQNARLID